MGTLQIDTLGTSFTIKAKESSAYLQSLLTYYNQIVKQLENNADTKEPLQSAILAGIMLCDELYKEKIKNAQLAKSPSSRELSEAEQLTLKMISNIEKALN